MASIPLKKVSVKAKLVDFLTEITVEQTFKNDSEEAIEAVYRFPIDSQAVMKSFQIDIDGRLIKGQVQEKNEAETTYDDAITGGHGAFLMSQDETTDIFTMRVGNLPPNSTAIIRLSYVAQLDEELSLEDDSSILRLVIPTAVAPRYEPARDTPSDLLNHADAVLAAWPKDLLQVEGQLITAGSIQSIEALTFKDETKVMTHDESRGATFTLSAPFLSQDFVLAIKLKPQLQDRAWLDEKRGALTVSVGLTPGKYNFKGESVGEYIFVIDRSGSMEGESILAAREALALCISALPLGSLFNVIGFGSDFHYLFPSSVAFDDAKKTEALQHCSNLQADLGGTEILQPLQDLVAKKGPPSQDRPRQILVITDGQVCNTQEVISFVRKDHKKTGSRYFSFGIGSGASRALVKGIAEAGGGYEEFIVQGERLQGKIMRQMNRALESSLSQVTIELGPDFALREERVSPQHPRPLFSASRLLFYALVDTKVGSNSNNDKGKEIVVKGQGPDGEVVIHVPLYRIPKDGSLGKEGGSLTDQHLEALATNALLKDYEDDAEDEQIMEDKRLDAKNKAIALSKSSQILCKYTSYVAVDERHDPVTGSLKSVRIPLNFLNPQQSYYYRSNLVVGSAPFPMMASCSMSAFPSAASPPANTFAAPKRLLKRSMLPPPAPGAFYSSIPATAFCCAAAGPPDQLSLQDTSTMKEEAGIGKPIDHISIVTRQRASGEWVWDEFVAEFVGEQLQILEQEVLKLGAEPENLNPWATLLALATLEKSFANFKDEWQASAKKAYKYLNGIFNESQPIDTLIAKVRLL